MQRYALVSGSQGFLYTRHGITEPNQKHLYCGSWDVPLSDKGRRQAEKLREQLHDYKGRLTGICTSPLMRAQETVEIINQEMRLPVTIVNDLREFDFGKLEGTAEPFNKQEHHPILLKTSAPGGESYAEFKSRVANAFEYLFTLDLPLVVSHGGVWLAMTDLIGMQQEIDNCVLAEVRPNKGGPKWIISRCILE
jgi:broad specificity phosphatase PhoE